MHDGKMSFQSVARTHPGAVRPCNEDAVLERGEAGIWAVSDGMGGHAAGDVASTLVIDSLKELTPTGDNFTSTNAVRDTLTWANGELYRPRFVGLAGSNDGRDRHSARGRREEFLLPVGGRFTALSVSRRPAYPADTRPPLYSGADRFRACLTRRRRRTIRAAALSRARSGSTLN